MSKVKFKEKYLQYPNNLISLIYGNFDVIVTLIMTYFHQSLSQKKEKKKEKKTKEWGGAE